MFPMHNHYTGPNDDGDAEESVNLLLDDSDGHSENSKSIDSDKTEDPRYPWDAKPKSAKPIKKANQQGKWVPSQRAPMTKTETPTVEESPTTKRLNTFSQDMDDLKCTPCFDHAEGLQMHSTNAKPPPSLRDLPHGYHRDWEIHPIRLFSPITNSALSPPPRCNSSQPLGAVIAREAFPMTANCGKRQTQRNHCLVKRLHQDGMAIRCGLKQGDWFLRPMDTASLPQQWSKGDFSTEPVEAAIRDYEAKDPVKLATFDEIQKWSKEANPLYRPIRVLRRRTKNNADKMRGTPAVSSTSDAILQKKPTSSKEAQPPTKQPPDSTNSKDDQSSNPPPYCVLCNYYNPSHWSKDSTLGKLRTKPKRPPRNHHTWCPKHKDFDAERVEKRLARTKHCYCVLGCEACHTEYQTGKVISVKKKNKNTKGTAELGMPQHNEACLLYQEMLQKEERLKHKQEEEKERKAQEEADRKKRAEAKKRKQNSSRTLTQRRDSSKRSKMNKRTRTFARGYESSNSSSSDSDNSDQDAGCEDGSIYLPPTRKGRMETFTFSKKGKELKDNTKKSRNQKAADEELQKVGDESEDKSSTHKEDKPVWVPLYDNPWGEEDYQTGDILLYGPQLGTGHHETLHHLSSQRYKVNPFGEDSTYLSTHRTPAEGLSLILLKRDAMGRIPWGFQVVRDEFGHACLVESIDSCSPASNATFLGVPPSDASAPTTNNTSKSVLNVNDMILLINGKQVGGMTKIGLELELEMAGPSLLLGISRYKHAQKVAHRFAEMERKMLDFMDRAARDDRLMGWREIGCGNRVDLGEAGAVALTGVPSPSQLEPNAQMSLCSGEARQRINEGVFPSQEGFDVAENSDLLEVKTPTRKNGNGNGLEHNVANEDNQIILAIQDKETPAKNLRFVPEDDTNSSETSEDSAVHDQNPQMGCVCGAKHSPSRTTTFWIQCESCNSWYHVAKKCIGFDEQHANRPNFVWNCSACAPDVESDEENSRNTGLSQLDKAHKGHSELDNTAVSKMQSANLEIHRNSDNREGRRSLPLQRKPPDIDHIRTYSLPRANSSQTLACSNKKSTAKYVLNDVSNSSQAPSPTLVHPSVSIKFTNASTPISAKEGPRSLPTSPHTPQVSSEQEEQSKKKPETPLAVRQLKSYNRNGLGYWENFESKSLPGNPLRCLRKRRIETNKPLQHRIDGGDKVGRKVVLMSTNPKNKKSVTTDTCGGKEILKTLQSRPRNRSVRKRVESNTECDDPSTTSTAASVKDGGETTNSIQTFKVGDLVFVESHAWAYVNNSGGIGKIQKAYASDDGDRVYDVKYPALDRTEKGIMVEFISPYSFD